MTVIINFKLLFHIFPLNSFCSKITSPEFIFGGVNFYSLEETSLSNHSVGCTLERLGKESNIWTFSVHYATLWTLIPQPHILSWETLIKNEHFLRTSALLICIPNWKHIRINFINKNNYLIDSTEQYQINFYTASYNFEQYPFSFINMPCSGFIWM